MNLFTREQFAASVEALGVHPSHDVFPDLAAAYSAPQRHYHDASHIDACLAQCRTHSDLAEHPAEVEVALWFHDAIYDTHRDDNEERSAAWARQYLERERADDARIARVHGLIIATRHLTPAVDSDQALLLDVDLGILGQPRDVFDAYDAAIRREYDWLSRSRWIEGRKAVLEQFLSRPRIYSTAPFYAQFEARARRNIAVAIDRLNDSR
jgi:predicted metal-dependent HD superfamily phosphohydrolase